MGKQSPNETRPLNDLTELYAFVQVVESSSFTAAARELGMTTPSISKRITALEQRLGVRLLERTTRHLRPTEAGNMLYARGRHVLDALHDARHELALYGDEPQGTLRVSAPVIFGEMHVAPLLPELHAQYPHMLIDLVFEDGYVNLVEDGYDVAVRIGRLEDSSLRVRRLGHDPFVVCAAPAYLERHGEPESPGDLVHHECLRYSLLNVEDEWRFRDDTGERAVSVGGRLTLNHGGAMREAAVGGAGLARLPRFVVGDALRQGLLRTVLDAYRGPDREIALVYPAGRHPLPTVRAFIDFLAERVPGRLA